MLKERRTGDHGRAWEGVGRELGWGWGLRARHCPLKMRMGVGGDMMRADGGDRKGPREISKGRENQKDPD